MVSVRDLCSVKWCSTDKGVEVTYVDRQDRSSYFGLKPESPDFVKIRQYTLLLSSEDLDDVARYLEFKEIETVLRVLPVFSPDKSKDPDPEIIDMLNLVSRIGPGFHDGRVNPGKHFVTKVELKDVPKSGFNLGKTHDVRHDYMRIHERERSLFTLEAIRYALAQDLFVDRCLSAAQGAKSAS